MKRVQSSIFLISVSTFLMFLVLSSPVRSQTLSDIREDYPGFRFNLNNPSCKIQTQDEFSARINYEYAFNVVRAYGKTCNKDIARDALAFGVTKFQLDRLELFVQISVAACIANDESRGMYQQFMSRVYVPCENERLYGGMLRFVSNAAKN